MLTIEADNERRKVPEPLSLAEELRVVATLNGLISLDDTFTEPELLQKLIDSYRFLNGQRLKKLALASSRKGSLRKLSAAQGKLAF